MHQKSKERANSSCRFSVVISSKSQRVRILQLTFKAFCKIPDVRNQKQHSTTDISDKVMQDLTSNENLIIVQAALALEQSGHKRIGINLYKTWLNNIKSQSDSSTCWYEYGRLLFSAGDYAKANIAFRNAIELSPRMVEAIIALAKVYEAQNDIDKALETWQNLAISLEHQNEIYINIGRLHEIKHDPEKSEHALLQSLRINPHQEAVISTILLQRQKMCKWPIISDDLPIPERKQIECIGPLSSLAIFDDPIINFQSAQKFVKERNYGKVNAQISSRTSRSRTEKKIRLGFMSADFRLHATSVFFLPLLENIDKSKFEIFLLDITTVEDPFVFIKSKLYHACDQWINLQSLDDRDAAFKINQNEIDVLIDLSGLTAGARPEIIAMRPAPVQISYLGFIGSSAIPNMDYILTAKDLFDPAFKDFYTERPLFLPDNYLIFGNDPIINTGTTRETCSLPEGSFVFCGLFNSYKINQPLFEIWMEILRQVPESVLWLVDENHATTDNLKSYAQKLGISKERLIFSPRVHPAEYRTRLALADLFLDSMPYGNGATIRDVISSNLPFLSKPGKTMMSRLTSHLAKQIGLEDFIVATNEEYVGMAIKLAQNKSLLAAAKSRMINFKNKSNLFNHKKFARDFENCILSTLSQ